MDRVKLTHVVADRTIGEEGGSPWTILCRHGVTSNGPGLVCTSTQLATFKLGPEYPLNATVSFWVEGNLLCIQNGLTKVKSILLSTNACQKLREHQELVVAYRFTPDLREGKLWLSLDVETNDNRRHLVYEGPELAHFLPSCCLIAESGRCILCHDGFEQV